MSEIEENKADVETLKYLRNYKYGDISNLEINNYKEK